MPQMMPLNWLILMLFFMFLFIMLMSFFHYIKLFSLKNNSSLTMINPNLASHLITWSW